MKKYLLPENGNFYKANLHCHTTVSDGKLSAERVKEEYMKRGYSVIAFTDHNVMMPHTELNDENFVALHGYEMDMSEKGTIKFRKTCHLNLIALEQDNLTQVCWHREKHMVGHGAEYRHLVRFDESLPDFERSHTPECINTVIKEAREHGFFVTYNHPGWSMENYGDYTSYKGMHALEIINGGGYHKGYCDYSPGVYDDLLRAGNRIFCVAGDDNHNGTAFDTPEDPCFTAFTVIKADKLDYSSIANALVCGNFYASEGPEIKALWFENGTLHVETSPCERIIVSTGLRKTRTFAREKGKVLKSATCTLESNDIYFRVTVEDKFGKRAHSNAYFCDELEF